MVPNVSSEVVLQLKNLKPGNCIAFGNAFKVPISMYIDLPDPRPLSNNVDLETVWYKEPSQNIVANGSVKENVVDTGAVNTSVVSATAAVANAAPVSSSMLTQMAPVQQAPAPVGGPQIIRNV